MCYIADSIMRPQNPRFSHFPVKPDDVGTTVRKGRGTSNNACLCGNFFCKQLTDAEWRSCNVF